MCVQSLRLSSWRGLGRECGLEARLPQEPPCSAQALQLSGQLTWLSQTLSWPMSAC